VRCVATKKYKAAVQQEVFQGAEAAKATRTFALPDAQDSQADEASIAATSQLSNVITAGFVETHDNRRYKVQNCMCNHAPYQAA